jgi:PAS domain S-box-containing protein
MASATDISVITCDMEGRIETFSPGAENIFGWSKDEVVGKKRVSLFSPGETVLEHVPGWLKTASTQGKYEGRRTTTTSCRSRAAAAPSSSASSPRRASCASAWGLSPSPPLAAPSSPPP